jgi:ferredoxin
MSKGMRIRLDRTMCDGFGFCAKHAPEYFSLDDWGYAALIGNGTVPEADRDAVMRALLYCPVHAIVEMSDDEFAGEAQPAKDEESASDQDPEAPSFEARWGFAR